MPRLQPGLTKPATAAALVGVGILDNLMFIEPRWMLTAPTLAEALVVVSAAFWLWKGWARPAASVVADQAAPAATKPDEQNIREFGVQLARAFDSPLMREKVATVLSGRSVNH